MGRILIVEDDPIAQELYRELLIPEGYQVICTDNGDEGLQKIGKYMPQLLILDLSIGGMNGRTLLMEVKKIAKNLPIFIASGKVGMKNDPEIELSPQVQRFFAKPINTGELLTQVKRVMCQNEHSASAVKDEVPQAQIYGECVLGDCIGKGASGVVYKASYRSQDVAVKVLAKESLDSEVKLARFKREANTLFQVQHPNIVKLLEMGVTADGTHFLVMEYFPGESIDNLLSSMQRFPAYDASLIICQVARGMKITHDKGVIHRDLKPSNLLYNVDSKIVKIIDFGIAREIKVEQAITQEGCVIGTPYYMSPEQCQSLPLDERSDIYSLGALFYQLLTGALPFEHADVMQTLFAHIYDDLKWPPAYAHLVPPELRKLITKMMEKDPQDRHQNMQEVVAELTIWLNNNG